MMVHIGAISSWHLHHDGAFFIFSMYPVPQDTAARAGISQNVVRYFSLAEPRGSAHLASFRLAESVIVGNTLPSEVSVSQAPIFKEVTLYFQG